MLINLCPADKSEEKLNISYHFYICNCQQHNGLALKNVAIFLLNFILLSTTSHK